jgi:hypothetical protein
MKNIRIGMVALALILAGIGARAAAQVSFTLSVDQAGVGAPVKITFSEALPKAEERYWLTIISAGSPDSEWGQWQYVTAGTKTLDVNAPAKPGAYEVRLNSRYPEKSSNVICRRPLTVGGAGATSSGSLSFTIAKTTLAKGEKPKVIFSSPVPVEGGRYWITVIPAGSADTEWGQWKYAEPGVRELELEAPSKSGACEIRLYGNYPSQSNNVIQRVPITVK